MRATCGNTETGARPASFPARTVPQKLHPRIERSIVLQQFGAGGPCPLIGQYLLAAVAMQLDSTERPRAFVHSPGTFVPLLQQEGTEVLTYVVDQVGSARELLTVGKGPGTRSDIDTRIDGQRDIDTSGGLSDSVKNVGNGAGSVASSTGLPSDPPVIRFRPGQPPEHET